MLALRERRTVWALASMASRAGAERWVGSCEEDGGGWAERRGGGEVER